MNDASIVEVLLVGGSSRMPLVAPFTLGIATAERFGGRLAPELFTPIIDRGTVIPVSRVRRFHTLADNRGTNRSACGSPMTSMAFSKSTVRL